MRGTGDTGYGFYVVSSGKGFLVVVEEERRPLVYMGIKYGSAMIP